VNYIRASRRRDSELSGATPHALAWGVHNRRSPPRAASLSACLCTNAPKKRNRLGARIIAAGRLCSGVRAVVVWTVAADIVAELDRRDGAFLVRQGGRR
jgi:hypothetical protein